MLNVTAASLVLSHVVVSLDQWALRSASVTPERGACETHTSPADMKRDASNHILTLPRLVHLSCPFYDAEVIKALQRRTCSDF